MIQTMHPETSQTHYDQCLAEMFALHRFGIKLGLDVIRHLLAHLGNPQDGFSCIHVAGTNGKGSIASGLAAILHAAGFRVGLYTSPHLVKFNERITINQVQVTDGDVVAAYLAVKKIPKPDREPTFFEYTTAMALHLFARARVDWAVIETGMGGRLDATNVLHPEISIISNISLEHRMYLGNTIAEITREKGGIIKENTPVVTGVTQRSAVSELSRVAAEKSAPLFRLGDHFKVRRGKTGEFSFIGMAHRWDHLKTRLPGDHQIDNAALILAACELLTQKGLPLDIATLRQCLETHVWPGRLEMLDTKPKIVIDGAHNLMSARKLARFLKTAFADANITLVIGILSDKPYGSILHSLLPCCRRVILTAPAIDRRLPPEALVPAAKALTSHVEIQQDVASAVAHAFRTTPPDDVICIAGSLYVVGEAKQALMDMGLTTESPTLYPADAIGA